MLSPLDNFINSISIDDYLAKHFKDKSTTEPCTVLSYGTVTNDVSPKNLSNYENINFVLCNSCKKLYICYNGRIELHGRKIKNNFFEFENVCRNNLSSIHRLIYKCPRCKTLMKLPIDLLQSNNELFEGKNSLKQIGQKRRSMTKLVAVEASSKKNEQLVKAFQWRNCLVHSFCDENIKKRSMLMTLADMAGENTITENELSRALKEKGRLQTIVNLNTMELNNYKKSLAEYKKQIELDEVKKLRTGKYLFDIISRKQQDKQQINVEFHEIITDLEKKTLHHQYEDKIVQCEQIITHYDEERITNVEGEILQLKKEVTENNSLFEKEIKNLKQEQSQTSQIFETRILTYEKLLNNQTTNEKKISEILLPYTAQTEKNRHDTLQRLEKIEKATVEVEAAMKKESHNLKKQIDVSQEKSAEEQKKLMEVFSRVVETQKEVQARLLDYQTTSEKKISEILLPYTAQTEKKLKTIEKTTVEVKAAIKKESHDLRKQIKVSQEKSTEEQREFRNVLDRVVETQREVQQQTFKLELRINTVEQNMQKNDKEIEEVKRNKTQSFEKKKELPLPPPKVHVAQTMKPTEKNKQLVDKINADAKDIVAQKSAQLLKSSFREKRLSLPEDPSEPLSKKHIVTAMKETALPIVEEHVISEKSNIANDFFDIDANSARVVTNEKNTSKIKYGIISKQKEFGEFFSDYQSLSKAHAERRQNIKEVGEPIDSLFSDFLKQQRTINKKDFIYNTLRERNEGTKSIVDFLSETGERKYRHNGLRRLKKPVESSEFLGMFISPEYHSTYFETDMKNVRYSSPVVSNAEFIKEKIVPDDLKKSAESSVLGSFKYKAAHFEDDTKIKKYVEQVRSISPCSYRIIEPKNVVDNEKKTATLYENKQLQQKNVYDDAVRRDYIVGYATEDGDDTGLQIEKIRRRLKFINLRMSNVISSCMLLSLEMELTQKAEVTVTSVGNSKISDPCDNV